MRADDLRLGETLEDAAHDQPREAEHVVGRPTDRGIEAVIAHPFFAIGARRRMDEDRLVVLRQHFPEAERLVVIGIGLPHGGGDEDAFELELGESALELFVEIVAGGRHGRGEAHDLAAVFLLQPGGAVVPDFQHVERLALVVVLELMDRIRHHRQRDVGLVMRLDHILDRQRAFAAPVRVERVLGRDDVGVPFDDRLHDFPPHNGVGEV